MTLSGPDPAEAVGEAHLHEGLLEVAHDLLADGLLHGEVPLEVLHVAAVVRATAALLLLLLAVAGVAQLLLPAEDVAQVRDGTFAARHCSATK